MDKIQEIKELVSKLNQYRNEYYNQNNPSISDRQYDDLFDQLKTLESETDFIMSNSPTQQVGYKVLDKLPKMKHTYPLLSLDKTTDINDFANFTKGKDGDLMLKMDGLTGELIFENGFLVSGSSRGDGEEGSLITENVKTFMNVPLKISYKGHLKVTGEMYIHKNDFDKINESLPEEEKYKTPRNLASGSVQLLDSSECAKRKIYFCAFNVIDGMEDNNSLHFRLNNLNELGFETVKRYTFAESDKSNIAEMIQSLREYAITHYLPIDGAVMMLDDIKYGIAQGRVGHHYKNGYAYKWEQKSADTTLRDVEWSMGKTNVLTPVAIFDTVILDNTEVSRASLHNISIIEGLKLGLGDTISIIKANQIIPQVTDNQTQSNNLVIPNTCPYCGGKTEVKQDNDSKVLICTNENCCGKKLGKFVNFVSKSALNIDGLSESTLVKFINNGFIETFADIYKLDQYKNQIIHMDGFGIKSWNKLWDAIQKSREVTLDRFLISLGIPQVGKTASKTISKYFKGNWQSFIQAFARNFNWTTLTDFGDIIANNLNRYFNNSNNDDEWKSLITVLNIVEPEEKENTNNIQSPFTGKRIYPTGTFANYKKDDIKNKLESLRAVVGSGYSKGLDYLIVGSVKGSGKVQKAITDGVKVISEEEFEEMIK